MKALETTDVLAGPPTARPVSAWARSVKNCPAPEAISRAPSSTNKKMKSAVTLTGTLKIPSVVR